MTSGKSYFRTTETGEIPCEGGVLRMVTVKSPSLGGRGDLSLYIPRQANDRADVPVVILLHGVYGSHWAWALSGKAHTTLQSMIDSGSLPAMILAMPSDGLWGDGSGYAAHSGRDFEAWIAKEVPQAVSEVTGNSPHSPHFISGLSMGGFGALRIGAKYPERFRAFSGHSSITSTKDMPLFVEEPLDAFGPELHVVEQILENRERIGPFRFDCGTEDLLIEQNRRLARQLQAEGIDFSYQEFPGGHEWTYWEEHIAKSFEFFASVFS
ncbi:alpha/beta hydrolase [Luteolibacter algae]|uniref:Alpha/beta hydrolase n=1 Tax=Luteolibacter algae TaxID=454151 RepID=A0ABW5DA02_9BACT